MISGATLALILGLSNNMGLLLIMCILTVCIFEFINGFHDTANAVATVIYTKSLQPQIAVVWSGIWNFLGVMVGGIGVAIGIVNLLPIDILIEQSTNLKISLVMAALLAAILWNFGTWYFGIPCSSSHTLIGSLLGVGLAFSFLPENVTGVGVNWAKAKDIGLALLFSPFFGFSTVIILMFTLRTLISNKAIFKEPEPDSRPPMWIRAVLITTCTGVSFAHGSNDGQKGVGLMLIILMTFLPLQFALNPVFDAQKAFSSLAQIEQVMLPYAQQGEMTREMSATVKVVSELRNDIANQDPTDVKQRFNIRKRLNLLTKNLQVLLTDPTIVGNTNNRDIIKAQIDIYKNYTDFAPRWTVVLISISLGLGTMIGWKRIVVTIGEKIGKQHLTYAQGASAELVAASTIGLSTYFGLPVSTTHVLSSGIAGSMVASKGVKNLQKATVTNIALAWVLTLPVTIILSSVLFYLFYFLFA